jgi:DNA-binding transcriptional LysR family regulator
MIRGEAFETEKSREKIRLALTDYAGMVLLPALARRMRTYAPNMTLEVVGWHDRVYDDIESGRIDRVDVCSYHCAAFLRQLRPVCK